jgi:hypothetical protein
MFSEAAATEAMPVRNGPADVLHIGRITIQFLAKTVSRCCSSDTAGTDYEVGGRRFLAIDLNYPSVGACLKCERPEVDGENCIKVDRLIPVQGLLQLDLARNLQPLHAAGSRLLNNFPALADQAERDRDRRIEMISGDLEEHDDRMCAGTGPGDCPAAAEKVYLAAGIRLREVG